MQPARPASPSPSARRSAAAAPAAAPPTAAQQLDRDTLELVFDMLQARRALTAPLRGATGPAGALAPPHGGPSSPRGVADADLDGEAGGLAGLGGDDFMLGEHDLEVQRALDTCEDAAAMVALFDDPARRADLEAVNSLRLSGDMGLDAAQTSEVLGRLARRCPKLQDLALDDLALGAADGATLAQLRQLRALALRNCRLAAQTLPNLCTWSILSHLVLHATPLPADGMAALEALPHLGALELRHAAATDLERLAGLRQLRLLRLLDCETTPAAIVQIGRLADLTELQIEGRSPQGGIQPLRTLSRLTVLALRLEAQAETEAQPQALLAGLESCFGRLERLSIDGAVDAESLAVVGTLRSLQTFEVTAEARLTLTAEATAPLAGLQGLRWLVMPCVSLDDAAVERLLALPRLVDLQVDATQLGREVRRRVLQAYGPYALSYDESEPRLRRLQDSDMAWMASQEGELAAAGFAQPEGPLPAIEEVPAAAPRRERGAGR